jgi:predicted phosphoribosyltransferase
MGPHKPIDLKNKTVIIADDGMATGNTVLASIRMIRELNPAKIIVAVPVAPRDTVARLKEWVDDVVCKYAPKYFSGVGQFYEDFSDVHESEVIALLRAGSRHSM